MIDRRTFLKLSAGALVLTAAGALTGCGGMNDRPKVTIDGVVFMCEAPVITGGSGYAVRYCPLFAIQNDTGERVILEPKDITGTFTDMENNMYPLEFIRNELTVEPHSYQEYGSSAKFCLESENRVPAEYSNGTFIMRVAYHNQTAVFRSMEKLLPPAKNKIRTTFCRRALLETGVPGGFCFVPHYLFFTLGLAVCTKFYALFARPWSQQGRQSGRIRPFPRKTQKDSAGREPGFLMEEILS